jgi:hypothetical protein
MEVELIFIHDYTHTFRFLIEVVNYVIFVVFSDAPLKETSSPSINIKIFNFDMDLSETEDMSTFTTNHAIMEVKYINRHAECLDFLVPNLQNQVLLRTNQPGELKLPVATQFQSVGKRLLHQNLVSILEGGREPEFCENEIIRAVKNSLSFGANHEFATEMINEARRNPSEKSFMMRLMEAMKISHTIHPSTSFQVFFSALSSSTNFSTFEDAFGYLIYKNATKYPNILGFNEFMSGENGPGVEKVVQLIKSQHKLTSIFLFLYELDFLFDEKYQRYFTDAQFQSNNYNLPHAHEGHRSMHLLSQLLHKLLSIEGCFVYCAGKLLSHEIRALQGRPDSAKRIQCVPVIFQPACNDDLQRILEETVIKKDGKSFALIELLDTSATYLEYLKERILFVTGGNFKAIKTLLHHLILPSISMDIHMIGNVTNDQYRVNLRSEHEIDRMLHELKPLISSIPNIGATLSNWKIGISDFCKNMGVFPVEALSEAAKRRMIRLVCRMVMMNIQFPSDLRVFVDSKVPISLLDVLALLGVPYMRGIQAIQNDYSDTKRAEYSYTMDRNFSKFPSQRLKINIGGWLCEEILNDANRRGFDYEYIATGQLFYSMRMMSLNMHMRTFESMVLSTFYENASFQLYRLGELSPRGETPSLLLVDVFPFFHRSEFARAATIEHPLSCITIPTVSKSAVALTSLHKEILMEDRAFWRGPAGIHPEDLAWVTSVWLRRNNLAIVFGRDSAAQDWYLSLASCIVAFSSKPRSEEDPLTWRDIRREVSHCPAMRHASKPSASKYILVLFPLHLHQELQTFVGAEEVCSLTSGTYVLVQKLVVRVTSKILASYPYAPEILSVPPNMEVLLVNPHSNNSVNPVSLLFDSSIRKGFQMLSSKRMEICLSAMTLSGFFY